MPNTINCDPGDVVLVRFPFTNLAATKQRPAVIVSDANFPRDYGDLILIPLTGVPQQDPTLELHDWRSAGLIKPTWVKPIIATINGRLVVKVMGKLQGADHGIVRGAIRKVLDARFV